MCGGGSPRGLNIDDALSIARQTADALAAAHGRGIVHRDFEPANVKVGDDGTVVVAVARDRVVASSATAQGAPSKIEGRPRGILGLILGTAATGLPNRRGQPFDSTRLELVGTARPVAESIGQSGQLGSYGLPVSHTPVVALHAYRRRRIGQRMHVNHDVGPTNSAGMRQATPVWGIPSAPTFTCSPYA